MTARVSGYVIALEEDIREDSLEEVINALRMIKGVVAVEPVISDAGNQIAEMRADNRWRMKIAQLLRDGALEVTGK